MITKDLGVVTAYGYAVSKGYTGTEEEFAELMASYATVAEEAAQSASTASEKAQAAAQAVLDAVAAKDAAVQAKNGAVDAKDAAAQSAINAASSATAASGSATNASQSAQAASDSASAAAQSATNASGSATAANTAKEAAVSAKGAAETAQGKAETAQSKAEEAQGKAEEAADDLSAEVEQIETNKNDIAELRSSVGSVITNTASGDIASFTDGADDYPVKDLVAHIEPVQSGSGDPSPNNVRPITGWTGANVTRTGKNLLDASTCIIRNYINSRGKIEATPGWSASDYIPVKSGETYTLSNYNPSGNAARHAFYGIDKSFLSSILVTGNNTFTVPSGAYYVRVTIKTENPTGAQLELGSTATAYEPYNGDTYAVTFPTEVGTVYGGTLDVTTGVLTVDKVNVNLSEAAWSYNSTYGVFVDEGVQYAENPVIISNIYPYGGLWNDMPNKSIGYIFTRRLAIKDDSFTTANELIAFLQSNNAVAVVPLHDSRITTYQLTPTEVKTILGANNIFADTGAVDVEYCADTKKYIDNAIATAIAAL